MPVHSKFLSPSDATAYKPGVLYIHVLYPHTLCKHFSTNAASWICDQFHSSAPSAASKYLPSCFTSLLISVTLGELQAAKQWKYSFPAVYRVPARARPNLFADHALDSGYIPEAASPYKSGILRPRLNRCCTYFYGFLWFNMPSRLPLHLIFPSPRDLARSIVN